MIRTIILKGCLMLLNHQDQLQSLIVFINADRGEEQRLRQHPSPIEEDKCLDECHRQWLIFSKDVSLKENQMVQLFL